MTDNDLLFWRLRASQLARLTTWSYRVVWTYSDKTARRVRPEDLAAPSRPGPGDAGYAAARGPCDCAACAEARQ